MLSLHSCRKVPLHQQPGQVQQPGLGQLESYRSRKLGLHNPCRCIPLRGLSRLELRTTPRVRRLQGKCPRERIQQQEHSREQRGQLHQLGQIRRPGMTRRLGKIRRQQEMIHRQQVLGLVQERFRRERYPPVHCQLGRRRRREKSHLQETSHPQVHRQPEQGLLAQVLARGRPLVPG